MVASSSILLPPKISTQDMLLGGGQGRNSILPNEKMEDFRIYNTALALPEMSEIYKEGQSLLPHTRKIN